MILFSLSIAIFFYAIYRHPTHPNNWTRVVNIFCFILLIIEFYKIFVKKINIPILLIFTILIIFISVNVTFVYNIFPKITWLKYLMLVSSFSTLPWLGVALFWITPNLVTSFNDTKQLLKFIIMFIFYTSFFLLFTASGYFSLEYIIDTHMPKGHKISDTFNVTNTIFVTYTLLCSILANKLIDIFITPSKKK